MDTQPNGQRRQPSTVSGNGDPEPPIVQRHPGLDTGKKLAAGVASGVVSFLLMRNYPAVGIFLILMLISGACGWWLGAKVLRSRGALRAALGWASLIVWILPFLGIFASGAVWNGQPEGRPLARERALAVLGLVLALINGTLGTLAFIRAR